MLALLCEPSTGEEIQARELRPACPEMSASVEYDMDADMETQEGRTEPYPAEAGEENP